MINTRSLLNLIVAASFALTAGACSSTGHSTLRCITPPDVRAQQSADRLDHLVCQLAPIDELSEREAMHIERHPCDGDSSQPWTINGDPHLGSYATADDAIHTVQILTGDEAKELTLVQNCPRQRLIVSENK